MIGSIGGLLVWVDWPSVGSDAGFGVAIVVVGAMPLREIMLLALLATLTSGMGGGVAGCVFGRFWNWFDEAAQEVVRVDKHRRGG